MKPAKLNTGAKPPTVYSARATQINSLNKTNMKSKKFANTEEGASLILALFNSILRTGHIPAAWRKARVSLIPKHQNAKTAKECRPISVHCVPYRVFTSILDRRLRAKVSSIIGPYQKYLEEKVNSCAMAANLLKAAILNETRARRSVYVASLDISKAFDSLSHESIKDSLTRSDIPLYLARVLIASLKSRRVFKCPDGTVNFLATCGVPQGLAISATMFVLALDAVREPIEAGGIVCKRG